MASAFQASWRHFKALTKKNRINWSRTPLGSGLEVICPVILMLILVWARRIVVPEELNSIQISALRHPLYPIAKPEGKDGNMTMSLMGVLENAWDMNEFMKYTEYTNLDREFALPLNWTNVTNSSIPL